MTETTDLAACLAAFREAEVRVDRAQAEWARYLPTTGFEDPPSPPPGLQAAYDEAVAADKAAGKARAALARAMGLAAPAD